MYIGTYTCGKGTGSFELRTCKEGTVLLALIGSVYGTVNGRDLSLLAGRASDLDWQVSKITIINIIVHFTDVTLTMKLQFV